MDTTYTKSQLVPVQQEALSWKEASEWSLVLAARHIPSWLEKVDSGYLVMVPAHFWQEAAREVELYIQENRFDEVKPSSPSRPRYLKESIWSLAAAAGLLSLFFRPEIRQTAMKIGAADASKIATGEWWRAFTALMLHADPGHFFSNVATGGFVVVWLIEETGPGAGWFLTIFSGAAGNYLNALFHGGDHVSIGASTAIFGALGGVAAIRSFKTREGGLQAVLKPVGAGLALLALLGTGGGNVDILAHLFGFLAGFLLGGLLAGVFGDNMRQAKELGLLFGLGALFSMISAWGLALAP